MKVSVVLSLITWHTTMLIFQICPIAHAEKKSNCMNLTIEVQPDKPVKSSVCQGKTGEVMQPDSTKILSSQTHKIYCDSTTSNFIKQRIHLHKITKQQILYKDNQCMQEQYYKSYISIDIGRYLYRFHENSRYVHRMFLNVQLIVGNDR